MDSEVGSIAVMLNEILRRLDDLTRSISELRSEVKELKNVLGKLKDVIEELSRNVRMLGTVRSPLADEIFKERLRRITEEYLKEGGTEM